MGQSRESIEAELANENLKRGLQYIVSRKLDEINHYVSGVDSPFTHQQITDVQDCLNEIRDMLGIGDCGA